MKTRRKILPAVCCIALLTACAANHKAVVAPLTITPMVAKNSSDNPGSMYQMGRYYQGQNRFDQAISAYEKALAADSHFVEARNGLGVIYSRQGKYREAIEAFQTAIQQAPKAAHLYSNMGYAYYLQGHYAESVAALKQATVLDPTNQRALNNLGVAYAKAGSKDESALAFSQAVNVSESLVTKPASESTVVRSAVASTASNASSDNDSSKVQPAVQNATVLNPELQALAISKDSSVIKPASNVTTVAHVDSRMQLVQLAPNVFELRVRQYSDVKPMQTALAVDDPYNPKKSRVEVANGNGVAGMAGKVGQFLRNQGYPTARLTNQKPFQVRVTQIQYRDGHQAEAQLLQASLPEAPELVQRNDLRADVGVRLVLGKDIVTQLAHSDGGWQKFRLALTPTLSASKS